MGVLAMLNLHRGDAEMTIPKLVMYSMVASQFQQRIFCSKNFVIEHSLLLFIVCCVTICPASCPSPIATLGY